MAQYRLIHVRNGAEIARYIFSTPDTTINSFSNIIGNIPLSGVTTFENFANNIITAGSGVVKDYPRNQLILVTDATSVAASLIAGLTGFTTIQVNESNLLEGDRLYLNRWKNGEPFINVGSNRSLQYICGNGNTAYNTVWRTPGSSNIQFNFYTLPWLYSTTDTASYRLSYAQISLDTRDNGLYGGLFSDVAPTSAENAALFWGKLKPVDDIDADISVPTGGTPDINQFEGDEIDLPSAPDETVSGVLASGFLNVYTPTDAHLRSFGAALWTNAFNVKWYDIDSVANLVLNTISDPINYIIGLFMLPVTPAKGASDGINLGGLKINTISVPKISAQFVTVSFGSLDVSELYGNYLDYSNTHISIYLPYIGVADIDVQEINGGKITLEYIIDVVTGACVANVKCEKNTLTPWGDAYSNSTVHSYSGNVAVQLPISAGSFDTMTQGLINVGLGLGSNSPAKVISGASDILQGMAGDVTTRGSLSSNTGKLCYQTPYLMFTRPIESRPAKLGSLHGFSAGVGGKLGAFTGYVQCTDIKLDGIIATDAEINELRQMCINGIYV